MFWDIFYKVCIEQGTKPNPVAKQVGVSSSTVTSWKNGGIPNGETLLKLADYLGVSVDYLLGRTDNQNGYSNNNLSNSENIAFGENAEVNGNSKLDGISKEMLNEFEKLPFKDKTKVMSLIAELNEKEGA